MYRCDYIIIPYTLYARKSGVAQKEEGVDEKENQKKSLYLPYHHTKSIEKVFDIVGKVEVVQLLR